MLFEEKIIELKLTIPKTPTAIASYIPANKSGNLIFTSGQLPMLNGKLLYEGKVGKEINLEKARECMIQSCLNGLAAIKMICGDLNQIQKIVKLTAFVASDDNFFEQHLVANSASELLFSIFGEQGKHSRSAVGLNALPLNSPVELEMIVEVK